MRIYLADHQSGAIAGGELAKRALTNNRGTQWESFLARLVEEIESDRVVLEQVMEKVGAAANPLKQAAAWGAEKAGRLKLNGQVRGYSPLSRVVELEGLCAGVKAKSLLWVSLKNLADPALGEFDFDRMIARADEQLDQLEQHRADAAATAFGDTD